MNVAAYIVSKEYYSRVELICDKVLFPFLGLH